MKELATSSLQDVETQTLRALFSRFETRGVHFAILRNYESLPISVGARDIDILVCPEDLGAAIDVVAALAESIEARFAKVFHDDMITQLILFRRVERGEVFELKIDFLHNRQVFGVEFLSANQMMQDLRRYNGIPIVSEQIRFLDKWLFNLFVGHPTDAKYDADFSVICRDEREQLIGTLAPLLGEKRAATLIDQIAAGHASAIPPLPRATRVTLLMRVAAGGLPHSLRRLARFFWHRAHNLLAPQGIFLSVSGPDGSGKTTVIDRVIAQLEMIYGDKTIDYAHFRPTILPRIAEVAKKARAVDTVDEEYDRPHRARPSGTLGSLARLGYYWADYLGGYFSSIRPKLRRRQIVLYDRYYYDMIADCFRSRIALPMLLLRAIGRLLPLPQHAFFIRVDPVEIYRRKQELTMGRILELNARYENLCACGMLIAIDNNHEPDMAVSAIIDNIVAARHARGQRTLTTLRARLTMPMPPSIHRNNA